MAKKELLLEGESDELESDDVTGVEGAEDEAKAEDTEPSPADWEDFRDHHLGAVIDNQIMGDKEAQDAAFDKYITVKTQMKLNPEEVAAPVAAASEEDLEGSGDDEVEAEED
jgi:hypothetical protein